MEIKKEISKNGFIVINLIDHFELNRLTDIVFDEFNLALQGENIVNPLTSKKDLINYHSIPIAINHSEFWSKRKRILGKSSISKIMGMNFICKLKENLGDFKISNEEGIQSAEIYWRLVRPNNQEDIGPIHADRWFWDGMSNSKVVLENKKYQRLKLWMPLYSETGISGLKVVKGSHLKEFGHRIYRVNGRVKLETKFHDALELEVLKLNPGQVVIFHDNLLHGGSFGKNQTRVSLEFTILEKILSNDN